MGMEHTNIIIIFEKYNFLLYLVFELYIDLGTLQQRRIDLRERDSKTYFDGHHIATKGDVISKESGGKAYCIIHGWLGFLPK